MAAITPAVVSRTPRAYSNRLEQYGRRELLAMGQDGSGLQPTTAEAALGLTAGDIAKLALDMALDGYATFEFKLQTETNDALVINLTDDLGIDFLKANAFRRIDWEVYANADADYGMMPGTAIVQCNATTPVVAATLQTAIADVNGIVTIETARTKAVATGDLLASGVSIAFIVPSQSSNDVILTFTGITNIDVNATVKVYVYPMVSQALFVTD